MDGKEGPAIKMVRKRLELLYTHQPPVYFYDEERKISQRMILLCPGKGGESLNAYKQRLQGQAAGIEKESWDALGSKLLTPMCSVGHQWLGTWKLHDFFLHWFYGSDVMWTIKAKPHKCEAKPHKCDCTPEDIYRVCASTHLSSTDIVYVKPDQWETCIKL